MGDGVVRMLAELGSVDDRRPLVEKAADGSQDAGLALSALTQQNDVMPGDQCAFKLRNDRALESVQAGPRIVPRSESREQVVTDLDPQRLLHMAGGTQLSDGLDGGAFGHRAGHLFRLTPLEPDRTRIDEIRACSPRRNGPVQ